MTTLPASLIVPALVRAVAKAGGFATVLHKGHALGSALLVVHRHAGDPPTAWERLPSALGPAQWRRAAEGEEAVRSFLERQQRFDPDIWAVELDIGEPARFIEGFPPIS
jgi:hypothetical protein